MNGKAYSIISDHLGTPILAVDSEGNEVWNRQLDIYGRVKREIKASSLGDDVRPFIPFLYQGQYYDFETNLAYNRFRYYSPETGAYISQDPIRLAGGNPTIYGYVKDNNWWLDVFGLEVITSTEIRIMEFTSHGVNRAIERSVAPIDILSAVKKPLKVSDIKIDSEGRSSQRFIGKKAEVVINPTTGKIISVNPTSTKKAKKLCKE